MKDTAHPQEAYAFLKYLMDQPWHMHYDLSVNRAAAEAMLNELCQTEYQISQTRGYFSIETEETVDYIMKPMTEELKTQITAMLEQIDHITLPNWPVYEILMSSMESYIMGECTLEESCRMAEEGLDSYIHSIQ